MSLLRERPPSSPTLCRESGGRNIGDSKGKGVAVGLQQVCNFEGKLTQSVQL